jgi:hypothetical protein
MINTLWGYVTGTATSPIGGSPRPRTTSPRMRKPDYSLAYLQDQVEELMAITGPSDNLFVSIPAQSGDRLVELIRSIAETLLWGEQNEDDSSMFDYFAEKGVMRIFVSLLNSGGNSSETPSSTIIFGPSSSSIVPKNRQITIQLLQTMSLLLLNVKRQTSLYYLLSNNAVNQLINNNTNLDFSDEEVLSYYISLMKSIALRLSPETIHFFVNERAPNYFPIFSQSIRFFDHHDRMVRIAVRTVTLAIFKLHAHSQGLQKFINDNSGGYFSLLACQLRDLWFLMDRRSADEGTVKVVADEMVDQLEYIAEVDRLGIFSISELLIEKLRLYALDGVLLKGLLQLNDGSDSPRIEGEPLPSSSAVAQILSLKLSLFVLIQLMDIMDSRISEPLLVQLMASEEVRSKVQSELKTFGPSFNVIVAFVYALFRQQNPSQAIKEGMSTFGITPPDLVILIAQSLGNIVEGHFTPKNCRMCVTLIQEFLSDQSIESEFKRPVRLTIVDSLRNASLRISQLIGDTVLTVSSGNEMNYSVIDEVERVLDKLSSSSSLEQTTMSLSDAEFLLVPTTHIQKPVLKLSKDHLLVFFTLVLGVKRIDNGEFSLKSVYEELFGSEETIVWVDAEEINSPPTPPPELIENESMATDRTVPNGPLPEDTKEGDSVDLGKRDRIFCFYVSPTSSAKASRYLVLDKRRLILVSPDLVKPGFATVKLLKPLRLFSSISVSREDQRVLVFERSGEQLTFEDAKRCHLALMHLETKRIDLRRNVYAKIESLLRTFVHYPV